MNLFLNIIKLYVYYYLWKITKLDYFLIKYSVAIVHQVRIEAKKKNKKPSKLDCLYNFNIYGGQQCWKCPIRKSCIERSPQKEEN